MAEENMLDMRGKIRQAGGCEVEVLLIHSSRWKTVWPGDSWLPHFLSDMTFPRKWTRPSDPAGRNRGGCSWSSDTMEREEGVTAIEVTQWLELQDPSVNQEGGGSSNPWNPDLLKEASKQQHRWSLGWRGRGRGDGPNTSYRHTWFWQMYHMVSTLKTKSQEYILRRK